MKWRHSVVYLVIFLLVGGYFYYFDVIKKEEKEAAEKESKRVFRFEEGAVQALEISSKDKGPVKLVKEERWRIVEPMLTEVDESSLTGFLGTLSTLLMDREVAAAPENLKTFGLHEPALRIRFQAEERWLELFVGDKNPVGDGYYAKTNATPHVFIVSHGIWGVLNKGADELRRKTLLSFNTEDVIGVRVAWHNGSVVELKRHLDGRTWEAVDRPELRIKNGKVDNLLDQVQWLRAQKFLENETKNLESHGLAPADVTVRLTFPKDKMCELLLSNKTEDQKKVAAVSSELIGVVQLDADILEEIPKDLEELRDRSLVALETGEIKEIKWKSGKTEGHVVWMDDHKWGMKKGDGEKLREIKDSWKVRSLLYDLGEAEYDKELDVPPPIPQQSYSRVEFKGADKILASMTWEEMSAGRPESATIWVEKEGGIHAFHVRSEVVDKIEENLGGILGAGQSGESSMQ